MRGVFLGYQESHHNYRVYLINEKKVVYSHNVIFNEHCFPLKSDDSAFTDTKEVDFIEQEAAALRELESSPCNDLLDDDHVLNPSSEVTDILVPSGIVEG